VVSHLLSRSLSLMPSNLGYTGFEHVGELNREYSTPAPFYKFNTPQTLTNQFDERVVVDYFLISTVSMKEFDESTYYETMIFPCDSEGEIPERDYSGIFAWQTDTPPSTTSVLNQFFLQHEIV